MEATALFILVIVVVAVVVGVGIYAVAARRPAAAGPVTGSFDPRAARRDRSLAELDTSGGVATLVEEEEAREAAHPAGEGAHLDEAAPPDPLVERLQISSTEYGTTRRMFLNRSLGALFGVFSVTLGAGILAMLWPKLRGGFGTAITVGNVNDIRTAALISDGTVEPQFFAAAQAWVVPFNPDELPGSSFEGLPVVVGGGGGEFGLMAMWQRCVHLGCRVPECLPSQGFECPCHGSKYNRHGEYEQGPAPRNLDRFAVEIDDAGNLVILTAEIFETPRAKNKSIKYPQGPFCV